ncbi:hypothetical protein FA15DRAFT_710585 [Coprinopsis marcescibilis]|uniref:Uncharacterized protein n=1 Tax=Coprinopsis marcescibilis TaxID=230819 RepID=A0A5C3KC41_COPMA|nr:hypothetical protein FA15DRAFT_710585 [Coprinopsis marcescibilis]
MAEQFATKNSGSANPNSAAAPPESTGRKHPQDNDNDNKEGIESEAENYSENPQPDAQPTSNLNCIPPPRKKCVKSDALVFHGKQFACTT